MNEDELISGCFKEIEYGPWSGQPTGRIWWWRWLDIGGGGRVMPAKPGTVLEIDYGDVEEVLLQAGCSSRTIDEVLALLP